MTDELNVSVRLTADSRGLRGELRLAGADLRRLRGGLDTTGREADRAASRTDRLRSRLSALNRSVNTLSAAFVGLGAGLALREVAQASLEWEKYERSLKAITGSQAAANKELEYVQHLADRLGLSIGSLAGDYAKFTAAANGTALAGEAARDVFTAVAEASRVLGLSSAETSGALNALQQMISKGNVQAEELRGQLGERIPGAFNLAARAMGKTTQELNEMLDSGEVLASDLLPKLAVVLREDFGEAAVEAGDSAAAAFGRFETASFKLKESIGTNLMPTLTDFTDYLSQTVIPTIGYWLEELGLVERKLESLSLGTLQLEIHAIREEIAQAQAEAAQQESAQQGGVGFIDGPGTVPAQLNARVETLKKRLDEALRREEQLLLEFNQEHLSLSDRILLGEIIVGEDFEDMGVGGTASPEGPKQRRAREAAAKKAAAAAAKAEKDAARERAKLTNETYRLLDAIDPLAGATRQYEADLETLRQAEAAGIKPAEELAEAALGLKRAYFETRREIAERLSPEIETLGDAMAEQQKKMEKAQEEARATARELGLTFESAFEKAVIGGESLRDVLAGITKDLATLVLRRGVTGPLLGAFDGVLTDVLSGRTPPIVNERDEIFTEEPSIGSSVGGSLMGAASSFLGDLFGSLFHDGGVVGASGGVSRMMPALAFAGAPRYHRGGIAGDEVPAVLRRGEEVLTRDNPRHRANGGGGMQVTIANTIDARGADPGAEARLRAAMAETTERTLTRLRAEIERGGAWARTVGR